MAKRGASWEQEPVSGATGASVPARSLPPVSALDRRTDGTRIGPCAACGGMKWWDNRSQKRAAQAKADAPDFRCVDCRHAVWEADEVEPWEPAATTVLPTATASDMRADKGVTQCSAVKADGQRCKGSAMKGSDKCGPHAGAGSGGVAPRTCRGVTKAGQPCRAGVGKGETHCPAHRDQA